MTPEDRTASEFADNAGRHLSSKAEMYNVRTGEKLWNFGSQLVRKSLGMINDNQQVVSPVGSMVHTGVPASSYLKDGVDAVASIGGLIAALA